ncbi:MAG: ABC transporter permease [Methylotenera sp.]|nr:ABC transporter permease [Oligoflexia bacterium]
MKLIEVFQSAVLTLGDFGLFCFRSFETLPKMWRRRGLFLKQCEAIGVSSSGVITIAAMFMGAVLGYQLYISFKIFGAEALLGGSIGVSLFRELGPVMTAIMVTGRAGASMAAEIATMRVTEQVDALEVMAVDPIEFLVTPRILAGLFMVPLLAIFFSAVASLAGAGIACGIMGLDSAIYWMQFAKVVDAIDMTHCVVKGAVFGTVLTSIGCFCGYQAQGGARAVGLATRNTVVATFLTVLCSDYILTSFLPFGFAKLTVNN